jgi:hypothetical protein
MVATKFFDLDALVVPEDLRKPAPPIVDRSFNVAGGDIDGEGRFVALEYRQSDGQIVLVSIVEGEAGEPPLVVLPSLRMASSSETISMPAFLR